MQTEIVIAGFGGQGVLFSGQVLSYAAMGSDKHVTWIPSYGPEMRGGTANCTVIISEEEIGSPLVKNPKAVVAMNLPSLDKYESLIVPDGVLIANASLIDKDIERTDLDVIMIPANDIAEEIGEKRLINMVLMGALLAKLPVLPVDVVKQALQDHLPERHQHTLPLNYEALHKGAEFALQGEVAPA